MLAGSQVLIMRLSQMLRKSKSAYWIVFYENNVNMIKYSLPYTSHNVVLFGISTAIIYQK